MNEMKTKRRNKIANTEKINTHVLTLWYLDGMYYRACLWWCSWSIENVPWKNLCREVWGAHWRWVKAVVLNISTTINDRTYSCELTLVNLLLCWKELTDVLKREHEAAEQCHICFKEFNEPENKKLRDRCYHMGFYWGAFHNKGNLKYRILDHILIVFHNLSGYDARLFIKELGKKFNKDDIGVIADSKEKYVIFNVKISSNWQGWPIKIVKKYVKIFSWSNSVHLKFFLIFKRTKRTKMITCPKCGSNDIRVYKETRNGVIYTVYICNRCGCGFSVS